MRCETARNERSRSKMSVTSKLAIGAYGSAYTYPTAAEVNYYMQKGMNVFRLPFRWERMQPTQLGALSAAIDAGGS